MEVLLQALYLLTSEVADLKQIQKANKKRKRVCAGNAEGRNTSKETVPQPLVQETSRAHHSQQQ